MVEFMKVSVIIPVFNELDTILQVIDAVKGVGLADEVVIIKYNLLR